MTISESYDFNFDRDAIIGEAYQVIGATALGEDPTADELTSGGKMLNLMLKGWQTERIALWLQQKVTLFLSKDTQAYSLGPTGSHVTPTSQAVKTEAKVAAIATDSTIDVDSITGISDTDTIGVELDDGTIQWTTVNGAPSGDTVTLTDALTDGVAIDNHVYVYSDKIQRPMDVLEGRRIDADGNSIPLLQVSRQEYLALPTKNSSGVPSQYYYDPQLTNGALYIWPTCSDVQTTLELTIKKPISDFDASTDTGEFPVEWLDMIVNNLAVRIGIKLRLSPSKELKELADKGKFMAQTFDAEMTSTFFQPQGGG